MRQQVAQETGGQAGHPQRPRASGAVDDVDADLTQRVVVGVGKDGDVGNVGDVGTGVLVQAGQALPHTAFTGFDAAPQQTPHVLNVVGVVNVVDVQFLGGGGFGGQCLDDRHQTGNAFLFQPCHVAASCGWAVGGWGGGWREGERGANNNNDNDNNNTNQQPKE